MGERTFLDASAERDVYMKPAVTKKQPTAAEIEAWLIAQISGRSGRATDDTDIREPFVYHGLNSKQVVSMTGKFVGISGSNYGRLLFEDSAHLNLYGSLCFAMRRAGENFQKKAKKSLTNRFAEVRQN
jgi:hypothetical protein